MDPLQLPPINEEVGKVFTDVKDTFELTEIVRQKNDNDLLELFDIIRNDIVNKTSNCATKLIQMKNKNAAVNYKVFDTVRYRSELAKYFNSPEFGKNILHIRQACYTRNAVAKWNTYVRGILYGTEKPRIITNDFLTSYTNQIDSFGSPILVNSEDYIVTSCDVYIDDMGIRTYSVNLLNCTTGNKIPKLLILDDYDYNSNEKITKVLNYLHYEANVKKVPGGFKNYFKFKNRILSMKDIELNETNSNRKVQKDIDYGFALTIHKLQGTTLTNVAIDLRDILYPTGNVNKPSDIDTRNRLLYVALSRATTNAIIHY